jgi:hypothetical protein
MGYRASTWGAGLAAAAKAVAVQDHKRLLDDAARRVRDSHRAQMEAVGMTPEATDDEMGDVNVSGDHITYQMPRPATMGRAAIAAAILGAAGLGAIGTALALRQPQQAPATDADSQYTLELSSDQTTD